MDGPRKASDLEPDHPLRQCPVDAKRDLPIPAVSVHLDESAGMPAVVPITLAMEGSKVVWDGIYAPTVYSLAMGKRCALCALPFTGLATFVGGPSTRATGLYNDGPMHLDCAEASLTLCPHLRQVNHRRSKESRELGLDERSERMFLVVALSYAIDMGEESMHFVVDSADVVGVREFHYVNNEIEEVSR